jgi:hypothetical protein
MMNAYARCSFLAVPLLAALGCSDPVPPPAQGAVTLDVGAPVDHVDQMQCPVPGKVYQIAAVDSKNNVLAPTSMTPGQSVISGEGGSSISCSVTGGGGNYKFSGTLSAVTRQGDKVSIQFSNGVVGSNYTGTADVSVFTTDLLQNFSSTNTTMNCAITVQNQQVKGGSIWATFSCPQIAFPPSGLCAIDASSAIVFENCSGS